MIRISHLLQYITTYFVSDYPYSSRVSRVAANTQVSTPSGRLASTGNVNSYHSSRRSSEDSIEEPGSIRDIRVSILKIFLSILHFFIVSWFYNFQYELKEVEEKFRKAMILNAQLDNDKASFSYQLELLKDKLEDLQEQYTQLQVCCRFYTYIETYIYIC